MTEGKAAICYRSRSEECQREAAVREASAGLSNSSALVALRLFDTVMSQWRTSLGGVVGLDYPAVFQVAPVIGVELDAEVFSYLRVLEADQLDAWKPAETTTAKPAEKRGRSG